MTTILHVKSSSNLEGFTRQIGQLVTGQLTAQSTGAKIIERDLVARPVPHIDPQFLAAMFSGNEEVLKLSNQLIDEVASSDVVVIEAPMYNFSIPSVMKAWIDHVTRAQKTFRYTATGPEGLLKGKKAILVLSSGGIYSEGPLKALDHQETYLRALLGFIGITDVETIRIEGVALGAEKTAAALALAKEKATGLLKRAA